MNADAVLEKILTHNELPHVSIYADGSCIGNPGPGGYAVVLKRDGEEEIITGGEYAPSTNQRMELMGVIRALEKIKEQSRVRVYSDSSYVVNGLNKWLHDWVRRGWRNAAGKTVSNRDLWERLLAALKPHKVEAVWIEGHNGHPENDLCHELARGAAIGFQR